MADYSPMMKQYFEVKEKYPNTLLFFRLGDFYEMFFNDAKIASRELELTLTGRDCGQEERAPMCGVPFHSAETYIARLVAKGYKVAICEQMEDPALAKGIVKRSVIRVITPGTVMESSMLDEAKNNYIASAYYQGDKVGICFADISTGELEATMLTAEKGETLSRAVIDALSRFTPRVVYGSVNGKDLRALWSALTRLPQLKALSATFKATMLRDIDSRMDVLSDVCELIDRAVVEEPPHTIREGGIIREGFNAELDEVKSDMTNGKQLIAELEAREREATGIPKLRVGYNRVFGYYLEVSNAFKDKTPEHYVRKQTLANGERYITQELKELENRILGAHDRSIALEGKLFEEVRRTIAEQLTRVQETAKAIAELDVLASFAAVSVRNDYTRPTITANGRLYLKDSRHPVVEALLTGSAPFVPNDLEMDPNQNRVSIITGPNMAGKSTYMRQVAVIVIMAQIGCFVPASAAEIGIVDGIYTRVGASDDLAAGQSTFMVEMAEVAEILKSATKDSLLVLDEIGRGTSTFDGMSIARAVIEYVHDKKLCGAKTLFATHYHELTELEDLLPGVQNFSIAVKKRGDDITFLRRIVRGGADDSFGIEVAKLAGVPDKVVRRAKEVLKSLESGEMVKKPKNAVKVQQEEPIQLTMLTKDTEVLNRLKSLDVNTLTPIESMNILFELANMLK